ncbi:MAG: tyrosine-type recombinase/integrase [Methyloceanibacter sp.]
MEWAMRRANKLSAAGISKIKSPGMYGDGDGLWLQVKEVESKKGIGICKSWTFRYMISSSPRYMGLGPLRQVSLAKARARASEARDLVYSGIDPIEDRRKRRDEARSQTTTRFKDAAKRFLDLHRDTWKNEKHKQQWAQSLRDYAYPSLGTRPIAAIDGAVITEALESIWTTKPETARRVKQRIERVVQWVKDGMPLPMRGPSKRVQHFAAMPFVELPAFMAELRRIDRISARALEFVILTAARTSEVLGAKWSEIDLNTCVWTIPAERMKAGKGHHVPLCKRAVEILESLPRVAGGYVFPGVKARAPLSTMTMLELLHGMGGDRITVHGFRSTFRDWAGDRTHYPREVIEHALAHQIKDKAEAAYRRGDALEKRRRLMEEWARYCASPARASGEVVALHG